MRFPFIFTFIALLVPSFDAITVSFSRRLDTCDTQDEALTDGTTKFVYAYSSVNPSTTGDQPTFHQKYGTRNARIMDAKPVQPAMPKDARLLDLQTANKTVPFPERDPTTSYYCHLFAINQTTRTHIVKWEPIFSPPENKKYVHHILVFECESALPSDIDHHELCNTLPVNLRTCLTKSLVSGWAVGGDAFYFPEKIGFPIGVAGTPRYVLMQTHYNNQARISPIIDNSGMRYTVTETLRPIEAAMLMQGYQTDPRITIPAGVKDTMFYAPCPSACTQYMFPQPVKIFASLLHQHMAGRAIKTRHIRNGIELPNILSDKYYDFNFQDFEYLPNERDFYPGDELLTECHYDTTSRTSVTSFGESTNQEMCLSFHIYYPRPTYPSGQCIYANYTGLGYQYPYNQSLLWCGNATIQNAPNVNLTTPLPLPTCEHITTDITTPLIRNISHFNTSSYERQLYLDGDDTQQYSLWWNVDDITKIIHFAIDVDVDGWVGLGFSPTGGMINADVITSWLQTKPDVTKNCTAYIGYVQDRMAIAHARPPLDTHQDIFNIVFYENIDHICDASHHNNDSSSGAGSSGVNVNASDSSSGAGTGSSGVNVNASAPYVSSTHTLIMILLLQLLQLVWLD